MAARCIEFDSRVGAGVLVAEALCDLILRYLVKGTVWDIALVILFNFIFIAPFFAVTFLASCIIVYSRSVSQGCVVIAPVMSGFE